MTTERMLYGDITVQIGVWHERESHDVRQCPSYYAADWEVLRTAPGDYPLRLQFTGGYTIPMPYWLLVSVDADRIDGREYSGFGGNNFASRELPRGPMPLHVQMYTYQLRELIDSGRVTVFPEFAGIAADRIGWADGKSFADIRTLADQALRERVA